MAQILVNFRLDEEDKKGMEEVCRDLGMSMSTAFTIFAKKMRREKRIPFDYDAAMKIFRDKEDYELEWAIQYLER